MLVTRYFSPTDAMSSACCNEAQTRGGWSGAEAGQALLGAITVARISLLLMANYTGQGAAENPRGSPVRGSPDLPGNPAYDTVSCWPGAEHEMLRGPCRGVPSLLLQGVSERLRWRWQK